MQDPQIQALGPAAVDFRTPPDAAWETLEEAELTPHTIRALFENRIPMIRIPGMANLEECARFSEVVQTAPFILYENFSPPIARVGPAQFEAALRGKGHYFEQVAEASATRARLCSAAGFDPLERLFRILREQAALPLRLAEEPDGYGPYFVGMLRHIQEYNRLHLDYGPNDGPDWTIGRVDAQLAWNFYFCAPSNSGACVVYNKPWIPADERFKVPDAPGYYESLVAGCQSKRMQPRPGDAILFNCRNFHEIEQASSTRISMSAFVGRLSESDFIIWS